MDPVIEVIKFISLMASEYDIPLEDILFGGIKKEIPERRTDWCFDIARLAGVI